MAMINCPECGKEISDKALTCPNCGAPVSNDNTVCNNHGEVHTKSVERGNNSLKGINLETFIFIIGGTMFDAIALFSHHEGGKTFPPQFNFALDMSFSTIGLICGIVGVVFACRFMGKKKFSEVGLGLSIIISCAPLVVFFDEIQELLL